MSIITDHHVHSEFSGDCNTPMDDASKKSYKIGIKRSNVYRSSGFRLSR